VFLSVGLYNIG